LGKAQSIVEQIVDTARRDPSLCLLNVESPALVDEYIFDHGVNVMMLGICVAEYLGYSERAVHELGVGAMLQDLGMIRVPADVRFAPRKLNPVEWVEVQRHPIHTVDLLEKARNAPARSMLIAYQAHERCDRSGYPRGRTRASILSPARLIACADTFVALTSPRPHRPALKPYDAMVAVLKDAHAGRLDAASVRAMLDCLSLFPVGSYVELSDGRRARVIRGNGSNHTQPVVQPMNDRAEPDGEAIDLSVDASVRVSAAADGSTPDKDAAVIAETAIGLSMGRG
jgi:HD-GYP domain-containing protein (c-di-GMP phosphodiesterase class II)